MHILIPMAGQGRRFEDKKYTQPKPLIVVDGKQMVEHVVEMFSEHDRYTFICSNRDLKRTPMRLMLKDLVPSANIIGIPAERNGPVHGILDAAKEIQFAWDPVIVSYCDFSMYWDYEKFKKSVSSEHVAGSIITYTGFHPHHLGSTYYGYCKVDENGKLMSIQEKKPYTDNPMNEHAAAGAYYFRDPDRMMRHFKEVVDRDMQVNGEFYASIPYNLMVRDGLETKIFDVPHFLQWGTPEDLEEYNRWSEWFSPVKNRADGTLHDNDLAVFKQWFPKRTEQQLRMTFRYWQDYFRKVRE